MRSLTGSVVSTRLKPVFDCWLVLLKEERLRLVEGSAIVSGLLRVRSGSVCEHTYAETADDEKTEMNSGPLSASNILIN